MKLKFRAIVLAASLGLACVGSQAGAILDGLSGSYNWKLQGLTSEYSPVQYGNESTWGIGQVTQINSSGGDTAWSSGAGGDYLYYVLYGIADLSVISRPGGFNVYNVGCTGGGGCDGKIHMDFYRLSAPINNILLQSPTDRIGFNGFNGISNALGASLYLGLEFVAGKVSVDDPTTPENELLATLFQNASSEVLPTSGTGTFFAEAVSGSAKDKWNSNGFLNGGADFDANFTLKPNTQDAGGACPVNSSPQNCFLGLVNDPFQTNAVPEPGSLALVGLSLAALALASRRRQC